MCRKCAGNVQKICRKNGKEPLRTPRRDVAHTPRRDTVHTRREISREARSKKRHCIHREETLHTASNRHSSENTHTHQEDTLHPPRKETAHSKKRPSKKRPSLGAKEKRGWHTEKRHCTHPRRDSTGRDHTHTKKRYFARTARRKETTRPTPRRDTAHSKKRHCITLRLDTRQAQKRRDWRTEKRQCAHREDSPGRDHTHQEEILNCTPKKDHPTEQTPHTPSCTHQE